MYVLQVYITYEINVLLLALILVNIKIYDNICMYITLYIYMNYYYLLLLNDSLDCMV